MVMVMVVSLFAAGTVALGACVWFLESCEKFCD